MTKGRVIGAVVIVAVVAAAGIGYKLKNGKDDGIAGEVETAQRREVVQKVNATGRIQPETMVKISADVSAKITRLEVEEGDWVEKGQLLVELDRERYLAEVESAEANLRASQANANLARENMVKAGKDYDRMSDLHEKALESQSVLDSSYAAAEVEKARHQSALDQVEQARAALKQARDALSKTTIYAPMSGTISKLNKEAGEIAVGSQFQADVIMELSNLSGMEALVDVDENDIVRVSLADGAEIEVDALPDQVFFGTVTEIASSAKVSGQGGADQKTEFEVKIGIEDSGTELRPGMTATADIVTEVRPDTLSVPIQSVAVRTLEQLGVGSSGNGNGPPEGEQEEPAEARFTPDEDGFVKVVFVVSEGKAAARQVETGIQSDSHIEILGGLEEEESVVIGNYRAISKDLRDGSAVLVGNGNGKGPGQ